LGTCPQFKSAPASTARLGKSTNCVT
jgi:hypothetical protein